MSVVTRVLMAGLALLAATSSAWAQPLGTYRWQQQPYCNVFTLNVIGEGGNYTLDGTDDLCGAAQKASVNGTAFFNPDGSIGFGLTIVGSAGGGAVHVKAVISLGTLSGTWTDSNGNSGDLVYTPGEAVPGSARPAAGSSPSKAVYQYDLDPGEASASISIPHSIPVTVTGVELQAGVRGVGHASLLSVPGGGGFIVWTGQHSPAAGGDAVGFSGIEGALIVSIDFTNCVSIQVAGAAGSGQIRVFNSCGSRRTGVVTVTY